MQTQENIQRLYEGALESLIAKVKNDRNIIAAILWGSLSHDQVWEKSDIDLWLVSRDGKTKYGNHCLVENSVNIHTEITSRNEAKKRIESGLPNSLFVRSTLLFSKDESIQEWYQYADRYHIGTRDKEVQLLTTANGLLEQLARAEKQFYFNKDLNYSFLYIMRTVQSLARLEVVLNDEVPDREVIQPALKYNPDFFNIVYTDLINRKKDEEAIQRALQIINQYLDDRMFIFQPILDCLNESDGIRSTTELNSYFYKQIRGNRLDDAYEWLAQKGIIQKVSSPVRLTRNSRIEVEEAAYYYDGYDMLEARESSPTPSKTEVQKQYQEALDTFVDKVQRDRYIIAAILFGDLAENKVWEKSSIDIVLISSEGVKSEKLYSLVENGINIQARMYPRSQYKKMVEGQLQGGIFHSVFSKSKLLFSKDETIGEWYQNFNCIGARDRETQLMNFSGNVMPTLVKAEKWFYIKEDLNYSYLYTLFVVEELARIETIMHGEVPGKKAIYQAIKYNPDFFNAVFTNLIHKRKDEEMIHQTLDLINKYIEDKIFTLFKPLLDFLSEAGGVRSATELSDYFDQRLQDGWILAACEWLAEKGIIEQVSSPLRLMKDSRIAVEEVAYYYGGGEL